MGSAIGWGALAASSLVIGAALSFVRDWSMRQVGYVLAFGAGALISAVSFELAAEGIEVGGAPITGIGLGVGAVTYFVLDGLIARRHSTGRGRKGRMEGDGSGTALALGAFLDGIPEQLVLGIDIAAGGGVGVSLLVAIFVSNLPEALGSSDDMAKQGKPRERILRLWLLVAAICALASLAGYLLADAVSGDAKAAIDGFAAGALLVMLIDSMIPDARKDAGRRAGLVTVLGFAVAAGLSSLD
ncbi:MAG TPA: ZIP family metal transporter [Solirubrobacterales bacterium]|nr:ZIP family metal transporter [Solirubrobacterales bacterium]